MTGRDGMTDEQVRAELERIDPAYAKEWDECQLALKRWPSDPVSHLVMAIKALRLLAESQQALGEIKKISGEDFEVRPLDKEMAKSFDIRLNKIFTIARKHWKGGK